MEVTVERPAQTDESWKENYPHKTSSSDVIPGESGWHMMTSATLDKNGELSGETRTWTNNVAFGFHGAVVVGVYHKGRPLYRSPVHRYGVAGRWFGSPNDRTDRWSELIPDYVLWFADELKVYHERDPDANTWLQKLRLEKILIKITYNSDTGAFKIRPKT